MKIFRSAALFLLSLSFVPHAVSAQTADETQMPGANLKAGQKTPEFSGTDQFGKAQDFSKLKGPNGLILLFFRSADW